MDIPIQATHYKKGELKMAKQKLRFKGVAAIGKNLKTAAASFVKVIAGQKRQLIVASNGDVHAVNAMSQVRFWDPKKGVAHARVLEKELNLTLASDGTEGEGVRAFTCACSGCKEVIIAESKLSHCILCASDIDDSEYEEVELDLPSNEELDALEDDEDEDCEGEECDTEDAEGDDLEDGSFDTLDEGDYLEDDEEEADLEDLEGDDLEEDTDELLEDDTDEEAEALEDEELIGDDLEDEDDLEIEDDADSEVDGDEFTEEDEDIEIGDALDDDEEEDFEDADLGDSLEEDDEDLEMDEDEEGDFLEDEDEDAEEGIAEEDDGDDFEGEEEGDLEDEEGDFYIDDEGSVNIDLVDGAELEDGDETDVEYSSAMSGNKRWIASVNGMPVAIATQATAGQNKEIFHTEKFGKVAQQVIASSGIAGLKTIGFTPIVVAAPVRGLIQASVDAEIAKSEGAVAKKLQTMASDFQTSMGMAAAGINRGFFGDVVNPLKVRMWEELSSLGIPSPHRVIDRVFKETAEDFSRVLIEKASELQAKPEAIRAELSKAIIGSNYLAVAEDEELEDEVDENELGDEMADRIEAGSMPFANTNRTVTEATSVVGQDSFKSSLDSVFKTL
jgi:hypothetical protein